MSLVFQPLDLQTADFYNKLRKCLRNLLHELLLSDRENGTGQSFTPTE
jgi:hypothetical protein